MQSSTKVGIVYIGKAAGKVGAIFPANIDKRQKGLWRVQSELIIHEVHLCLVIISERT